MKESLHSSGGAAQLINIHFPLVKSTASIHAVQQTHAVVASLYLQGTRKV